MNDALATQVGGSHYKGMKIQPMEFSMANGLDACQHTIIKYVARFRSKGGVEDLEKAKHCIDMLIGFEKAAQEEANALEVKRGNLSMPYSLRDGLPAGFLAEKAAAAFAAHKGVNEPEVAGER